MREEELAAQQEHLIAARLDMPEYKPEIKIEAGGDDERRKNVLEAERQVITELETTTKLKKIVKGDVAMNAVSNSLRRMEDVIPQNTGKFKSFQEAKTLCGRFFKEAQDISDKFDAVAVQLHAGRELTKDTLEKAEAAVKSLRSFKNDLIV